MFTQWALIATLKAVIAKRLKRDGDLLDRLARFVRRILGVPKAK